MNVTRHTRCYARVLALFPRSFREEFGYEMVCDFSDAFDRAIATGSVVAVALFWTTCASDLVCNVVVQWLRTGFPIVVALAMGWTLLLFGLLALQGIPPNRPEFADLHLVWLVMALTLAAISVACGRYYARPVSGRRHHNPTTTNR
jgi:hypothetical protein